jgi:hypothetical protein
LAAAALAAACAASTTATPVTTTGIVMPASTLTTQRGCGTAPSNVFKYAVVVFAYEGNDASISAGTSYNFAIAGQTFDCFTDGVFVQLPVWNGSTSYRLEVYAYNQSAWNAQEAAVTTAVATTNASAASDAATAASSKAASTALQSTSPTWTTQCRVTQSGEVETLATCDPVLAGTAGVAGGSIAPTTITVPTASFKLADGTTATCNPAAVTSAPASGDGGDGGDAGDAADTGDAGDAGDAGVSPGGGADAGAPGDGGAGVEFARVRIRWRTAAVVGPVVDVPCPGSSAIPVLSDPETYTIDIGLLDSAGNPIGTTECSAVTQTGTASSAVCP